MVDGLNFIRKNEIYFIFIGMMFFNSVFGMSYLILMPVFARNILDVGSEGFGFLQSLGGAGAPCGVLTGRLVFPSARQRQTGNLPAPWSFGVLLICVCVIPIRIRFRLPWRLRSAWQASST